MDIIEKIRLFKRVAEKKSFSSVAKEHNMTQPTISKAVASLEKQLAVPLFRRSTRGLSLTVEGQKLLHSSKVTLDQYDTMIASVRSEKLQLTGQMKVGASLAFARIVLAPLMPQFVKENPGLSLHFQLSDGFVDLIENNIDVAIRIGDLADSSLKGFRVGLSRRALYANQDYIKNHSQPKSIIDLNEHRLLFFNRIADRPSWPLINKEGGRINFNFTPFMQSDGSDLIREAVLKGLGIALLPTWTMVEEEKNKIVRRPGI